MRLAIAACHSVVDAAEVSIPLSVSIGGHLANSSEEFNDVLSQADRALYAAKAAGRNCYRTTEPSHD